MAHHSHPGNDQFIRGQVLDLSTEASVDDLVTPLLRVWQTLIDVAVKHRVGEQVSVLIEIWADSGRVIAILTDDREFARIVLAVENLERACYEIEDDDELLFEREYSALVERVRAQVVKATLTALDARSESFVVTARDSDDAGTEQVITEP